MIEARHAWLPARNVSPTFDRIEKEKTMLPFAVGLIAGAVVVKLIQKTAPPASLDKTREYLRHAGVSGLCAIERSSAQLRQKLASAETPPQEKPVQEITVQSPAGTDEGTP